MSTSNLYQNYKEKGFLFGDELITRYALSLYSKPFVILSGISGTGKSKLAQLFDPPFQFEESDDIEKGESYSENFISINLTEGVLNKDGRGNFRFSDLDAIFEPEEIEGIEERIEDYKERGVGDNITEPELFTIILPDGERIKASVYLQRASSPLLRVRFKSKRGDSETYKSHETLSERYEVNDVLKLRKINKREFQVESVNDENIVKYEKKSRLEELQEIDNKLFVPVKSNWTDSSDVFGFYNLIEEKYQVSFILKFLLKAQETPEIPFFLILDEMNLSKVEHYFSDILSCLESRINVNGNIQQESILLHSKGSYIDSDDIYFDLIPGRFELPTNLFITGTVNIDESTYMFSPKVLDRANVIEFNEVNLETYEDNDAAANSIFKFGSIPDYSNYQIALRVHFQDIPVPQRNFIKNLNTILKGQNLHFGYRTANEISLFILNTMKFIGDSDQVLKKALDIQISQKILPKLHGSYNILDEPLRKLIAFLVNDEKDYSEINSGFLKSLNLEVEFYPISLQKLKSMYIRLESSGFTSYLE